MGAAASAPLAPSGSATKLRVVGLGDPITDVHLSVDAAALAQAGVQPGSVATVRWMPGARRAARRARVPGAGNAHRRPRANWGRAAR
jgi:hypothetical protein